MPGNLPPIGFDLQPSEDLPEDLRVFRFQMAEALFEPYTILLEAVTMEPEVEQMLGASLGLDLCRHEYIHTVFGVVASVEWLGVVNGQVELRLTVKPALSMLGQGQNSRSWEDCSALEIITEVLEEGLKPYNRKVDVDGVQRDTATRDYCVQYRESDLDFVTRLMEEEGISYYFVHDEGCEVLTLFDTNEALNPVVNIDDTEIFPVITHNPDEAEVESVLAVEWRRELTPTGVVTEDYDWRIPDGALFAKAGQADTKLRVREVYVHGRRRFCADDLETQVGDMGEALSTPQTRGHGRGNARHFHAGFSLTLDGHELDELGDGLILTRVEHSGSDPMARLGSDGAPGYTNFFECVPATQPVPPRRVTPKPRVYGAQTALVIGPKDEAIHVDDTGRIRVRFHWGRDAKGELAHAECWIRVAQAWAGGGWGAQFIPRVGMEVVVDFLEGNPDRPLAVGCVYNGNNSHPYPLPDNKTMSGIRSDTYTGEGSNELRFEDQAGSEQIYLHGQKDWSIVIENDKDQSVGNNETLEVGNDRSKHVIHDETVNVDNDETITVGNNHTETIAKIMKLDVGTNQMVTVGVNHTETIGGNRVEQIQGAASETVAQAKAITVGGAMQISVGGALNQSVGGASAQEVGGALVSTVKGVSSEKVGDSKTVTVEKNLSMEAKEAASLAAAKDFGVSAGEAMALSAGKDFSIDIGAKGLIEAADKLTLKCGSAQIVLESGGDVTISGGKITVKGSGEVKIQGSKVGNN